MDTQFEQVADAKALDMLFERSHKEPVLLFKHSNACPISARAYREMETVTNPVSLIIIQKSRDISHAVEERTGIQHESPQALLLRDGRVVWSATHFDITADAVEQAFKSAGAATPDDER